MIEPGRSIVSDSGIALARVAFEKRIAEDDRPFILQKAGGLQGTFTYIAFAPARNAAVFIALNKFDFGAAFVMGRFANELLEQIAPR